MSGKIVAKMTTVARYEYIGEIRRLEEGFSMAEDVMWHRWLYRSWVMSRFPILPTLATKAVGECIDVTET